MMFPKVQHQVVAQFHQRLTISDIEGKWKAPDGIRARAAASLPVIVRDSQWVRFSDRYFHLRKEGLYRFYDWGTVRYDNPEDVPQLVDDTRDYSCVILFRNDILALFGAIATLQYHGYRHDRTSFKEQLTQLKRGTLSLQCGTSTQFVCSMLNELGWKARPVSCIRPEGAYNNWNNGHILFEFYWPKYRRWILADVNGHRLFVKDGKYLHAGEVADLIRGGGDFEFEWLTPRGIGLVDVSYGMLGEFPGTSYSEYGFYDDVRIKASLRQLLVMPLLAEGGIAYFYHDDPKVQDRICRARSDARAITRNEWWQRFYGKGAE